jgi:hypothetical protein
VIQIDQSRKVTTQTDHLNEMTNLVILTADSPIKSRHSVNWTSFTVQACSIGAMAFSIMILSIKGLFVTLSKMALDMESCCAECHDIFTVMMNVIMLNAVMVHVVAPLYRLVFKKGPKWLEFCPFQNAIASDRT